MQPLLEVRMTDEQEQMLQAVLRNQEVIMNALAELLAVRSDELPRDLHRGQTIAELGTCVGFTHYYLADLESDGSPEVQRRSEN
jgi:hypothetical protein